MARQPTYSPKAFYALYQSATSTADLAQKLGLSLVTTYKWIRAYNLPKLDQRPKRSKRILRQYHHHHPGVLRELAVHNRLTVGSIKYHLRQGIHHIFDAPKTPKKIDLLARPIFLHEIPLFNALLTNISLRHSLADLQRITGLPLRYIDPYLLRLKDVRNAYREMHPNTNYPPNPRSTRVPLRGRRGNATKASLTAGL